MSGVNSKKMFYRLRSLKSIFEYKELENQEIYFASLDELNDPMEGFRNIVFMGNLKDWYLFFERYLQSFEWAYIMLDISIGTYNVLNNAWAMYEWVTKNPSTQKTDKIRQDFFRTSSKTVDKIASRTTPINKDELLFYLEYTNFIVLDIMHKYYNPLYQRFKDDFDNINIKIIQKIDEIEKHINDTKNQETIPQILDKSKPETRPMYLSLNMLNTTEISENNLSFFLRLLIFQIFIWKL
ncbi:MAG: hypothetical protein HDT12_02470 [Helicobacter sp.]|nr:hypothetical protein [Helicobacter sp.]